MMREQNFRKIGESIGAFVFVIVFTGACSVSGFFLAIVINNQDQDFIITGLASGAISGLVLAILMLVEFWRLRGWWNSGKYENWIPISLIGGAMIAGIGQFLVTELIFSWLWIGIENWQLSLILTNNFDIVIASIFGLFFGSIFASITIKRSMPLIGLLLGSLLAIILTSYFVVFLDYFY